MFRVGREDSVVPKEGGTAKSHLPAPAGTTQIASRPRSCRRSNTPTGESASARTTPRSRAATSSGLLVSKPLASGAGRSHPPSSIAASTRKVSALRIVRPKGQPAVGLDAAIEAGTGPRVHRGPRRSGAPAHSVLIAMTPHLHHTQPVAPALPPS